MAVILFGHPCKICKKSIAPAALKIAGNERRGYICDKCQVKGENNYHILTQQLTQTYANEQDVECQRCNKNLDEIKRLTGLRSLFAHTIDGVLALLCQTCSDYFIPRSGQFNDTEFGKKLKIAGYK